MRKIIKLLAVKCNRCGWAPLVYCYEGQKTTLSFNICPECEKWETLTVKGYEPKAGTEWIELKDRHGRQIVARRAKGKKPRIFEWYKCEGCRHYISRGAFKYSSTCVLKSCFICKSKNVANFMGCIHLKDKAN